MKVAIVLVLLLAAPFLAGCVANPVPLGTATAEEVPDLSMAANWYEPALARGAGHNHADLAQHLNASTPNFALVGQSALTTYDANGRIANAIGCGEVGTRSDGRVLAFMNVFGRNALILADITDPSHPFKAGEFVVRGVSAYDAAITKDGKFGLVAFNALVRQPGLAAAELPGLSYEDGCTGATRMIPLPDVAVTNGVIMLDLTDPAEPAFADYWPTPSVNLHSVATAEVDGLQYVVASIVNLAPAASWWEFLLAVDTPAGGKLVPVSRFEQPPVTVTDLSRVVVPTFNGHGDAQIQKHPINGMTYAYLAGWDGGLYTLDITVPAAPVMVAMWAPPASTAAVSVSNGLLSSNCYEYAVHDAFPMPALLDGKHYLFAQQECPFQNAANKVAGQVFILDNTDPLFPKQVGAWNLPVSTSPWTAEYVASPHYLAVVGETLFATMYHAGLWAIDLSGDLTAPPSIGVYMPDRAPPVAASNPLAPSTLQVNALADGSLALFEERTGVYIVDFDATNPAPAALPRFR